MQYFPHAGMILMIEGDKKKNRKQLL